MQNWKGDAYAVPPCFVEKLSLDLGVSIYKGLKSQAMNSYSWNSSTIREETPLY